MGKRRKQNIHATAIYTRVSTQAQAGEDRNSLGTQETACRDFCAAHELPISEAHIYRETFSGAELYNRPKLNDLREAGRAGAIDALVCYAIDRLSRDPVHLGVILSEADHHGVAVHFVTEPLDHTMEGELIRFVRGYAAKVEREKIKERTLRGKRGRLLQGKPPGYGMDLYGYRRERGGDVWRVYEPEAAVVREMFALATDGVSVRAIADTLNRRGVPSPSVGKVRRASDDGPRWGKSQVARTLRHPWYKGEAVAWRWQHMGKNTAPQLRPESEWVTLPAVAVPALVSPALWQAVQRHLDTNRGDTTRNAERPYLLRGRVTCAVCGRRMQTETSKGTRYYRCPSRQQAAGACGAKMVAADAVEAWVWERVRRWFRDEGTLTRLLTRESATPDTGAALERDAAAREIARIATQQDRLIARFGEGGDDFPWAVVTARIEALQRERAAWQERYDALTARAAHATPASPALDRLAAYVGRPAPRWEFGERRDVLALLGVRVVAANGNAGEWRLLVRARGA